jgi:hypothetical protein
MDQRRCIGCRVRFIPARNPNQRYCSKTACQRKRRCTYQKERVRQDSDYRENQCAAEQNWHKRHPDYWRCYRKGRPEQMKKNRIAQQHRDKRRRLKTTPFGSDPMLATMYSFSREKSYLSSNYDIILGKDRLLATIGCYREATYVLLASPS